MSSLKFNPLLSELNENFSLCKDLAINCEYFSEGNFNKMLADCSNHLNLNNNCENLALLHLNIRSISEKLDKFSNSLGSLALDFSVIGITETWLDNSRVHRDGGGVSFYLAEYLKLKNRMDLTFVNDCAESLFVEVIRQTEKKIVIGVIYRPPDRNLNEFIGELDQLLSRISKENKLVYLLADWNINLLCHSNHHATGEFLELMYSKTVFPLITRPTRITEHKASLIDNIFKMILSIVLQMAFFFVIYPIFSIVSTSDLNTNERQFFVFRHKNPKNIMKFKEELSRVNWAELPDVNDPLLAYNSFLTRYMPIYNVCFPLRKVKVKKHNPWFTKGLSRSVKGPRSTMSHCG